MPPPVSSAGGWAAAGEGPLTRADLDGVRFDTAVRGYRMDQVDALLERVRMSLDDAAHRPSVNTEGAGVGGDAYPGTASQDPEASRVGSLHRFPRVSSSSEGAPVTTDAERAERGEKE
ncbi:DivIVA domain-containing protein [Dermatophilus congolensis]|nr:DivIVA domain-containing protein [Dermatophilus congolensis]MBO3129696.1 DivIVA domain-containing protein [Dermatophilus congolensis]MBO3131674.1 DivIVA domain-containing protein [Dermatophilus congolensis]MBO3134171.1 DivIVA domain-containing protein [Dermatophilus congolensis]MBO3136404.1 DivIVA domain-containing protein [Dermatophilus congolensis]MBO3138653.1 DivIVA domain-containing protein [Dermatophilus congolensis]